jgi:predicted Zn-dependent protease
MIRFLSVMCVVSLLGCANQSLNQMGAAVLSSTGYVDQSQAEGFFSAGQKLVKSQEDLTPEQEYYLGRAVSAQVLSTYPPTLVPSATRYLNQIGNVIAAVSDVPETFNGYRFALIESPQINAVSAPGGFVFITTALYKQLPDEDCVAAVLAHEVAHVVKRHGVKAVSNAALFSALSDFSSRAATVAASQVATPVELGPITSVFAESVSGVTEKLLSKGYDRRQEYEADLYAATLLQRAGYDPRALVRALEILNSASVDVKEGGWFATHPSPADRIEELEDDFDFPASPQPVAQRVSRFKRL